MAIKLIVNGFFRSGTTILWKILRENNPNKLVFYEPCHENLFSLIYKFKYLKDNIHKMKLWDEYFYDSGFIDKLRIAHPNLGDPVPSNYCLIRNYVSIFNNLNKDVILQVNRWHLFLNKLSIDFQCNVAHVIRNPFYVYNSIIKTYMNSGIIFKKIIKYFLYPFSGNRAFNINKWYSKITKIYGISYKTYRLFDKFLIVWILTNFSAIKAVKCRDENFIIVYEDLLKFPQKYQKMFERIGINFYPKNYLIKKNVVNWVYNKNLIQKVEKLGLKKEYMFIKEKVLKAINNEKKL